MQLKKILNYIIVVLILPWIGAYLYDVFDIQNLFSSIIYFVFIVPRAPSSVIPILIVADVYKWLMFVGAFIIPFAFFTDMFLVLRYIKKHSLKIFLTKNITRVIGIFFQIQLLIVLAIFMVYAFKVDNLSKHATVLRPYVGEQQYHALQSEFYLIRTAEDLQAYDEKTKQLFEKYAINFYRKNN